MHTKKLVVGGGVVSIVNAIFPHIEIRRKYMEVLFVCIKLYPYSYTGMVLGENNI